DGRGMRTYPRLPEFDPRRPEEPAVAFGSRALAFLVQHGITATLDDEALEQAEHAAIYVVASRDIALVALQRVNAVRLMIAATLKCRLKDRAAAAQAVAVCQQASPQAPEGGARVPSPRPLPRRPSPSAAAKPF